MRGLCCEDDSGEINVLFPHEKPSPTTIHNQTPTIQCQTQTTIHQQSTTIQYHPLTTNINHQLPSNHLTIGKIFLLILISFPGAEPLVRLLPPYIPPPPPRAPSFPCPNPKPSLPCRNPSLSSPQLSSPHPQEGSSSPPHTPSLSLQNTHPSPLNPLQSSTCVENQLSVPASDSLHPPLDLSSVSEPLTEDLLLRLLQEHQQVGFLEQQSPIVLNLAGGAGEHFSQHSGAQIAR